MNRYIHLLKDWPAFKWEVDNIILPLSTVRHKQGRLLGKLEGLGFRLREEATLKMLTQDVVKSSEIEGVKLPADQVRSSIGRPGIKVAGEVPFNRNVEGVVGMMLDATQRYDLPLTNERLKDWPAFKWEVDNIILPLSTVRHKQGRLLGKLEGLGFRLREEATLEMLTKDVVKSREIEGVKLPADQVRSSMGRPGIKVAGEVPFNRNVEGVVEMMLDATQRYDLPLTNERLFGWHAALFPTERSGTYKYKLAENQLMRMH